jgi:hypothetical protein
MFGIGYPFFIRCWTFDVRCWTFIFQNASSERQINDDSSRILSFLPSIETLQESTERLGVSEAFMPACAGVMADRFSVNPEPLNGYVWYSICSSQKRSSWGDGAAGF